MERRPTEGERHSHHREHDRTWWSVLGRIGNEHQTIVPPPLVNAGALLYWVHAAITADKLGSAVRVVKRNRKYVTGGYIAGCDAYEWCEPRRYGKYAECMIHVPIVANNDADARHAAERLAVSVQASSVHLTTGAVWDTTIWDRIVVTRLI